ncbi:hypothetical protein DUNSADRAFT_9927 [Dunaliella salina]|uniref:Uncharacterized protein n=1 Tax=Dunaliella salina TaxID=3046 RepID=A0ABQ7GGG2_DUNSA|nr:hypothetical protein DUNSADRAFT_9927 [Dunaliella salina]|eukprot:KAF5833694.1 hypothetical protein DUNSADRAFT_9927 [Dunaliella salina]
MPPPEGGKTTPTPPNYVPPGGYPYTPSMDPPSRMPPPGDTPPGTTPPGTTSSPDTKPPSYVPPGGYPYTPSMEPPSSMPPPGNGTTPPGDTPPSDTKPPSNVPPGGYPYTPSMEPPSSMPPPGTSPPGDTPPPDAKPPSYVPPELPFTSGKTISIRSPSLGKYCAPDDATKLLMCNQDTRDTGPDNGFLIIGENYVTNKIYEGESILMKVQSKFTVCGVSAKKPGNPMECANPDSEDSTHLAFRFAPAPQPEGKALLQLLPAEGVIPRVKTAPRHQAFDDVEVLEIDSMSAAAEGDEEEERRGGDSDAEEEGDQEHDGKGDGEGAVQESVVERQFSRREEDSLRRKAQMMEWINSFLTSKTLLPVASCSQAHGILRACSTMKQG